MGKYNLISKTSQNFRDYTGNAIRLTKSLPYTVDEILVGQKSRPYKKITTFRDSNGEIIERVFNYKNKPLRNRIYKKSDYTIGQDEYVTSTNIKEYTLPRAVVDVYKSYQAQFRKLNIQTTLWTTKKTQTNHVAENINNGNKILSIVKIEKHNNSADEIHSFTEYPEISNGKKAETAPKILRFSVNNNNDVIQGSIETKGVLQPEQDSFLGYRALDIDESKEAFTQRFLKERGISKLGYTINTNYIPENNEEKLSALFSDGQISFNRLFKMKSKAKCASTSRHEVEHGWQYYLDARNGGQRGEFLEELGKSHGPITNKKLLKEAQTYTQSLDNYVPYNIDYARYRKNYIEIRANEEGLKAQNQYNQQGKSIRQSFKHIPKELL